jgi:serine/threonine protein kinase
MDPHEAQLYTGQTFTGKSGNYLVGGLIGSGGFGGVFEGVDQASGADVAVKVLAFNGRPANAQLEFEAEMELLRLLVTCSNVVTLLDEGIYNIQLTTAGLVFPVQVPFMVLDRATIGLEDLLAQRHQLAWLDRMRLYRDVVKGCHQMHLKRLVHRDLKAANALVYSEEPHGRVTDLGRSKDTRQSPRFAPNQYQAGRGDLRFAPPELLWGLGETTAEVYCRTDLYLLGSLFYEFATATGITAAALTNPRSWLGRAATLADQTARERDFHAHLPYLYSQYAPLYTLFEKELPRSVAKDAVALLRQLTDADPSRREPMRPVRGLPIRWDLQWVMYRVDIFVKRLEIEANQARSRSRSYRRRKVVKAP